jgi:hypothetical protein
MAAEDHTPPPSAPKWQRMPGAIRIQLDEAIAGHLNTHRAGLYDLLRDDPRFVAWTGTHLGHRGEKRLDRAIGAFKLKADAKLRVLNRRAEDPGSRAAPSLIGSNDLADRLAGPGAAPMSVEELQADLRENIAEINSARAECRRNGDIDGFLKLSREWRAATKDSAQLSKSFNTVANSNAVIEQVYQAVFRHLADEPDKAVAIAGDISSSMFRATGLAATGSEQ